MQMETLGIYRDVDKTIELRTADFKNATSVQYSCLVLVVLWI